MAMLPSLNLNTHICRRNLFKFWEQPWFHTETRRPDTNVL